MNFDDLKETVEIAEKSVEGVDPELQVDAFKIILKNLLQEKTQITE